MIDTNKLLEEILGSFDAQQLCPTRGTFFREPSSSCPLVALAVNRGMVRRDDPDLSLEQAANPAFDWACDEFGEDFVFGLLDGFDGKAANRTDSLYLDGFRLGEKAAALLLPVPD